MHILHMHPQNSQNANHYFTFYKILIRPHSLSAVICFSLVTRLSIICLMLILYFQIVPFLPPRSCIVNTLKYSQPWSSMPPYTYRCLLSFKIPFLINQLHYACIFLKTGFRPHLLLEIFPRSTLLLPLLGGVLKTSITGIFQHI